MKPAAVQHSGGHNTCSQMLVTKHQSNRRNAYNTQKGFTASALAIARHKAGHVILRVDQLMSDHRTGRSNSRVLQTTDYRWKLGPLGYYNNAEVGWWQGRPAEVGY